MNRFLLPGIISYYFNYVQHSQCSGPILKNTIKKENFQDHGGVKAALYHLYWTDDLKVGKMDHNYDLTMTRHKSLFTAPQTGTHVGTDEYGNKYYHNPAYFRGRDR